MKINIFRIFSVCAPPHQLSGCIFFANPQTHVSYFLQNDLLCYGTCSLAGVAKRTGGTNGKDPIFLTGAALKIAIYST